MSTPLINYIYIGRRGIYTQAGQIKLIVTLHSSICIRQRAFCVRSNSSVSVVKTLLQHLQEIGETNRIISWCWQSASIICCTGLSYTPCTRLGVLQVIREIINIFKVKTQNKQKTHPTKNQQHTIHSRNQIFQVIKELTISFQKKNTLHSFTVVTASQYLPWILRSLKAECLMAQDATSKSIYFYPRQMKIERQSLFSYSTQLWGMTAGEQRCQFVANRSSRHSCCDLQTWTIAQWWELSADSRDPLH